MFAAIDPTDAERADERPGDELVPSADVVMDRGFTVAATPEQVWPWLQQLGKQRAGWYLPAAVERLLPPRHRAIRHVDDRWQHLSVGDVVPDYGPSDFRVEAVEPGRHVVYSGRHEQLVMSWSISLTAVDGGSRVHLRLRLGPVRRPWLARSFGGLLDLLTVAGMATGLRQRLDQPLPV